MSLSALQRQVLARVVSETIFGRWYRATGSGDRAFNNGERVTLASLYRCGFLDRRAWRGQEGAANAAYEYQATEHLVKVALELRAEQAKTAVNPQPKEE